MTQDEIIYSLKTSGTWKVKVLAFICKVLNFVEFDKKDADFNLIIKMYVKDKK